MNRQELKQYYEEHSESIKGHGIKRSEHRDFRKYLKLAFPFIDELKGRKELSIYLYCLINDIDSPPPCEWCGDPIKSVKTPSFPRSCSYQCNGKLVMKEEEEKNLKEFGVRFKAQLESTKQKAKETFNRNWGADHHMKTERGKEVQRNGVRSVYNVDNVFELEHVKEKSRQTNLLVRGVPNPMQDESVKNKVRETNMRKLGVPNPMQHPDIQKKAGDTTEEKYGGRVYPNTEKGRVEVTEGNIERWGVPHNKQRHIDKSNLELLEDPDSIRAMYTVYGGVRLAETLGVDSTTVYDRMKKYDIEIIPNQSFAEKEIADFICSIVGDTVITSDKKVLNGKEIDILIPSIGIGIEYNGLYYHSVAKGKDRNYHLNKTDVAKSKGIRLIHIFEDEWIHRKDQVKSKIMSIIGVSGTSKVFARKCTLHTESDLHLISDFYEKNHIQGKCKQRFTFSLRYEGEVVAMMSFKCRGGSEYELTRYATSMNVVGGFSKLLKFAKPKLKEDGCSVIVSFADKRYSVGNVYIKNGWDHVCDTPPDYQYVKNNTRERKQKYRRKYLPRLPFFDESMTEFENVMANGIYPIYDCGLMKFKMEI